MTTVQTPLFEPVIWSDEAFKILDETLLPNVIEYIEIRQVDQALEAVREMKTRAFGQVLTFLYSAALLGEQNKNLDRESLRTRIGEMTDRFAEARPTFDFRGLGEFFSAWFEVKLDGRSAGQFISESARRFAQQIVGARMARAKRAASLLPQRARILTHCNISGELVAIAEYARESGKDISVVATETRPYLQGARLTAWELAQAGVVVSVIPDSAIGQVFARHEIDAAIVGADRCAQNGDVINKVGTYPIALLAKEYGVPFYVLVQNPGNLASGADVEIEERPAAELLEFQGRELLSGNSENLAVRYPAFDVTPGSLVTRFVGFDDVFTIEEFQKKFQKSAGSSNQNRRGASYLLFFGVPPKENYDFLLDALRTEKADRILIPEMRPALYGPRLVAPELLKRKAPVTLVSDNMLGVLFRGGEIRKVYLAYSGLDDAGPRGICGSLLVAQLARLHGIPVQLHPGQDNLPGELDRDVATFLGQRNLPSGASVHPIEQEVLPCELFPSLVNDNQ